jgi:hypothetical protein
MKTDTALTFFCMATIIVIVGLVMFTTVQLGIGDGVLTGNYYLGVPLKGQVSRESIEVNYVQVDPHSPSCYADGAKECQRKNAGENFIFCTDQVALECGMPHATLAGCFLPAGFELKYHTSRECSYGAIDECRARCAIGLVDSCVKYSKGRCELIGGVFYEHRQQQRRRAYTSQQLPLSVYR